jgi:hypothetical protein
MNRIGVAELISEALAVFGEVGAPLAALGLSGGIPRLYIMRLDRRGLVRSVFTT